MPLPPVMQTNSCKLQTQKRRQDKYQCGTRISHCLTHLIFCRFLWLYRPSCGAAWATSVERHASHPDSRRAERRLTPKMRACVITSTLQPVLRATGDHPAQLVRLLNVKGLGL